MVRSTLSCEQRELQKISKNTLRLLLHYQFSSCRCRRLSLGPFYSMVRSTLFMRATRAKKILKIALQVTLSLSIFIMSLPPPGVEILLLYGAKHPFMRATRATKNFKNCSHFHCQFSSCHCRPLTLGPFYSMV